MTRRHPANWRRSARGMWLHVPKPFCRSAPEPAALTWDSAQLTRRLASCATWNGKPLPPPTWSRRLHTVGWMMLLCGQICEPSTAALGVASWIGSWRASRASLTASPATSEGPETNGTSGPIWPGLSGSAGPAALSSKTSPASCGTTTTPSGRSFREWATELRKDYSRRQKWALPTSGSDCSYWPTPLAMDINHGGAARRQSLKLSDAARAFYPTPAARDWKDWDGDGKQSPSRPYSAYIRQGLTIAKPGHTCSKRCRRLNPLFAEWLMGWPPYWTLIAITDGMLQMHNPPRWARAGGNDFQLSATALALWWQRLLSAVWAND